MNDPTGSPRVRIDEGAWISGPSLATPAHPFIRPGQVRAELPAPDQCMKCGQPEAAHGGLPPGWQVLITSGDTTTSYIVHADDELTAAARAGQEHEDRLGYTDVEPRDAP